MESFHLRFLLWLLPKLGGWGMWGEVPARRQPFNCGSIAYGQLLSGLHYLANAI